MEPTSAWRAIVEKRVLVRCIVTWASPSLQGSNGGVSKVRHLQELTVGLILFFLAAISPALSQQQPYPSRPVTILVPFNPGSEADILARLYAAKLSERMGHPFVVENRAGAGGVLAAQTLLNAPADGYDLMFVTSGFAINPSIYQHLSFDTSRDFSGIALVGHSPALLVTSPSLGVRTQQEFISLAKQRPGQLNYGSAGTGSASYFSCQYFASEAKINVVNVSYKGVQEFLTDLLGDRIQLACPPMVTVIPLVRAGKLVALSVTSKERESLLPDVPTTSEAGLSGFEYGIWYGLVASSKTPRFIIDRLAKEMSEITNLKDISEAMANQGVAPRDVATTDFDAFIATEIGKFRSLVKASGINMK